MTCIIHKKKANQLYYYVVESARVDSMPRIVQQTYLGTAERFGWQAFGDCLDRIQTGTPGDDPLDHAQSRLLAVWTERHLVSHRLLAYDTTNFYTYVASTNTRHGLAQRGHNKQGRHNLVAEAEEFPIALGRTLALLDRHGMARDTITVVLDKGSAALANTLELEQAGVGWISALPCNQAPAELRERPVEQLSPGGSCQPGVRAAGEWLGWGPMHHWTDSKIRVHAFYCMLGISLLQYIHKRAQAAWPTSCA